VPNGTYYVRVRALGRDGTSPPSNEVVVVVDAAGVPCTTPPAPPKAFQVTVTDATGIDFTWDRPTDNCFPTGYLVLVGNAPGLSNLAAFQIGPGFAFEFDVPVGAYYVRLVALNQFGQSGESNEVVVVWSCGGPPGPPHRPTAVVTGAVVALSWSGPVIGCAPSSYELHAGSAPGLSNIGVFPLGSATTFAATAPSGTYYVRIVARNRYGAGAPSTEMVVVVP
jgi:predicted phage tail protein